MIDIDELRRLAQAATSGEWYRDKSIPTGTTLCGAPCGYYDVPIRDTKYKKFSLRDPFWATKGGFCPECLKLAGVSE